MSSTILTIELCIILLFLSATKIADLFLLLFEFFSLLRRCFLGENVALLPFDDPFVHEHIVHRVAWLRPETDPMFDAVTFEHYLVALDGVVTKHFLEPAAFGAVLRVGEDDAESRFVFSPDSL